MADLTDVTDDIALTQQYHTGGGVLSSLSTLSGYRDVPQTWVAKSASLIYQWSLVSLQILVYEWVYHFFSNLQQSGANFNKCRNFHQKVLTESKYFWENLLVLGQILTEKLRLLIYEWVTFSRKNCYICMGLLSDLKRHVPTQTKPNKYPLCMIPIRNSEGLLSRRVFITKGFYSEGRYSEK